MRIGELAALAGVSVRTVRHYHQIGLLPEPARHDNGYRSYQLRDLVLLLRARRLVELGLSLEEVADAIADDSGRDLTEILTELDRDLAARQRQLQRQRDSIAGVLAAGGELRSGELTELLGALTETLGEDHPGLARERLAAELVEATVGGKARPGWTGYRQVLADPGLREQIQAASRRFEELAGRSPDDPEVAALAQDTREFGPAILASMAPDAGGPDGDPDEVDQLLRAVSAGMAPAQVRCLTLMVEHWRRDMS